MHPHQSPPPLATVRDDVLDGGHLWLREAVAGAPLRFRLDDDGLLRFGDADRAFDAGDPPLGYRFATRAVRARFDRDGLREAVDDPSAYTFLATATRYEGVPYDFDRLPPVCGVAIVGPDGRLDIDRAVAAFDRLGLPSLPVLDRERHVRDFHPDRFEWPASAWYDGPVDGVVVTNRRGPWALLGRGADRAVEAFDTADATALAERLVTPDRVTVTAGVDSVATARDTVDPDRLGARVADDCLRETWARLDATGVDVTAFVDAVTDRTRRLLADG